MSSSIDYFFNSDKSFQQLCEEMKNYLDFDFNLSKNYENQVYVRFLGIGLDFYIHDFEGYEDYKYFIGLTARPYSKHLRVPITAFVANILYLRMDICDGILVYNLGRILAKYREEINSEGFNDMYDEVSNKFVEFPQHLLDLDKLQ